MKIEHQIAAAVAAALKELYGAGEVTLEKTKKEFEGHYTFVVFPYLRASKKKPEVTAQEVGEYVAAHTDAVASWLRST